MSEDDRTRLALYDKHRQTIIDALSYAEAQLASDVDAGDDHEGTLDDLTSYRIAYEQLTGTEKQ